MNLEKLNKYRVRNGAFATKDDDAFGMFFIPTKTGLPPLKVISSKFGTDEWNHVSVSLPNRCPTWNEMCLVKDLFWSDDETVIQFHPKKTEAVDNHPYCLHLWSKVGQEIELPPSILVGFK